VDAEAVGAAPIASGLAEREAEALPGRRKRKLRLPGKRMSLPVLIAMILAAAVMLAPLIWTLLLSLKANQELVGNSGAAFTFPYTLENYAAILNGDQVFRWLLNSLIVSIGTTIGVLALCSLAGYGFARLEFPFRRTLFIFVLLGLAIPEQAVILPQHQLFAALGLHNSYPGLILPGLAGPFGVFFMTQYFRAIPKELDEAAMLDGASRFRTFWKVLMPLTIPAQATLGVFTFLGTWNSYWWPLISATRSDMYTLTVGLASAQMNYAQTSGLGFLMAQAVFASIPIFIVYILFQKHIVAAMSGTATR
jgi:multiple sugar transport system permease protein